MDLGGFLLLAILGGGVASYWPSARGHWSGFLLALPSVLTGLMILLAIIREGGRVYPAFLVIWLVYLALGLFSIALWSWRRHTPS